MIVRKCWLRLHFGGEPAIDYGGPTREFFSLLLKSIENNTSLLDGSHDRRILRHNATAIQVRIVVYFIISTSHAGKEISGCGQNDSIVQYRTVVQDQDFLPHQ